MTRLTLTPEETIAVEAALNGDVGDPISLMTSAGVDVSTFFEFGDWRNVDFQKSDLRGVSFFKADLRGAQFTRDQALLIAKTKPKYRPTRVASRRTGLNLKMPDQPYLRPRITVVGVGGAGTKAVDNMIYESLEGVDFVVANTDAQALQQSNATTKLQIGANITEGLGSGGQPDVGAAAALENIEEIVDMLAGAHMCFIVGGMGGGTGTGAAPIIATAARELGILTVGIVTKPFQFEGTRRTRQAEEGITALQKIVDTLIIIPNQNLFGLASKETTFTQAFAMADDVLYQGVKVVADLMIRPGVINLDFSDICSVMREMGKAMMGTGKASGENRAIQAAERAIANPLLDEISLRGAGGVLINITGGDDLTLFELDEAATRIREETGAKAHIIVGSTLDPSMEGFIRVSVVATGIDIAEGASPTEKIPVVEGEPKVGEASATERQQGGRFAINNLINRITGYAPNTDVPVAGRQMPTLKQQTQTIEDVNEEEQECIDIPAFLRRQAN